MNCDRFRRGFNVSSIGVSQVLFGVALVQLGGTLRAYRRVIFDLVWNKCLRSRVQTG
ncbi:hypothetical protein H6F89_24545 [Cyanobacteria bacterium FACHB-63]|nr:hypothetical protein [Cyanobacteria bacterium FACHB-63]